MADAGQSRAGFLMNVPVSVWKRLKLEIRNASPLPKTGSFWRRASQVATVGMFLIFFVTALSVARTILLPVTLALVIGTMLSPVTKAASRYGIPAPMTAALLVLGFFALISSGIILAADPVREWIGKAPEIGAAVKEKLHFLDAPLAALNDLRQSLTNRTTQPGVITVDVNTSLIEPVVSAVSPAIGQLLLFFGTLFFYLAGHNNIQHSLLVIFDGRDARLRALRTIRDLERNLAHYLAIVTTINFTIGVLVAIGAHFIGLPAPLAWGVLAFVLNYVPYIGPGVTLITLFGVGLVSFPWVGHALIAPACYLALVTLEGQVVTPSIIGRTLTVNPMLVFLAIAFWAWLWGPFGALLANPLLIVGVVAIKHLVPKQDPNLPE
jgi:predicted PurR-regulated permease PerM